MAGMAGSISSIMQAYSGFEGRIVEAIGGAVFLGPFGQRRMTRIGTYLRNLTKESEINYL